MTITGALGFTIRLAVLAAAAYAGFHFGGLWFAGWKLGSLSLGSFASSAMFIAANEFLTKNISEKVLKGVLSTEVAAVIGAASLASLSMHAVSLVFGILKFVTSPLRSEAPDPMQVAVGQLSALATQMGTDALNINNAAAGIVHSAGLAFQAQQATEYYARLAMNQQQPPFVPQYRNGVNPQALPYAVSPMHSGQNASAPPRDDDTEDSALRVGNDNNYRP